MKQTARSVFIVLVLVVTAACTATSPYMRRVVEFKPIRRDAARVVFIRPSSYARNIGVKILEAQGQFIGESLPNSRFAVKLPPGEYTFIVWGEGTHALRAKVAGGRTYYIEVASGMGVWTARFQLKAIKESTANWENLDKWLNNTAPHEVLFEQGQQYADSHSDAMQDAINKGVTRYAQYNDEDLQKRTLAPEDGI